MKVTYNVYFPLDGLGTLLHPAYKWDIREREEFCDTLMKAGNCWYMMRGGYVYKSIDVDKITKIELKGVKAECKYHRGAHYPFTAAIFKNGTRTNVGHTEFKGMFNEIMN